MTDEVMKVDFWRKTPIEPLIELTELHAKAIAHNPDRNPIWKLRLAPDLVLKMQPKPCRDVRFKGEAIMCQDANEEKFKSVNRPRNGADWFRVKFEVWGDGADFSVWWFKLKLIERSRKDDGEIERLRGRVVDAFKPGGPLSNIHIGMMLHPHCIYCGKGLTDPASMARMIGPECANTSRLEAKHIIDVDDIVEKTGRSGEADIFALKMAMAQAHPDKGGSSAAFIDARKRYIEAVRQAARN